MKLLTAVSGLALAVFLAGCEKELILPGERFAVRTPLAASIPTEEQPTPVDTSGVVENQSLPITLPAPSANADWPQRGGNGAHLAPHGAMSAQPVPVWSAGIGAGNSRKNRISAAPVVADGRVFTLDATATLAATSAAGAALWSADLRPEIDRASDVSGGGLAYGGGQLFAATGYGDLLALDPASGAVVWRQRLGAPVTGAPMVDAGTVYVVGRDGSAWAVATDSGRLRWQLAATPSSAGMIGSSAPAISDGNVLLPFASGELVAVLKDGGVRVWGAMVAGERLGRGYAGVTDITGDPVVDGPVTYAGSARGRTVALESASGKLIWSADEGALGPVLAVGGSLFLVSDEARLVRLDAATGAVIWAVDLPYFVKDKVKKRKEITAHYGPVLAGGRLVVASGDGLIRLFDPTDGTLVGTLDLPGGAAAQPALAGGTLYVVSAKGQLHAFR